MLHNALPSDTVARYGEIVDEWTASAVGVENNAALIRLYDKAALSCASQGATLWSLMGRQSRHEVRR